MTILFHATTRNSIATVSLSGSLAEKLEAIAAAGFSGVEIFENDLITFDGSVQDVRQMCADLGLPIVLLQPFRDFEGMPEPQRSRIFDRAERKFDLMQQLGTDLLMVCSNVSPIAIGGIQRAADDLRELGERATKRNLRICFEALAWARYIYDYRDAWEVVRRADQPNVGLLLDSFHILSRQLDLTAIASIPGDRIFFVQLADAPLMEMGLLSWSRHYRCFPGQGWLPLEQFMRALALTGYQGYLSLEVFNDQFRTTIPRITAVDGRRSLTYLAERLAQDAPSKRTIASTSQPEQPLPLIPMIPPAARYHGIEFLEFATNKKIAPALEGLLAQLGFQKRGHHHSKQVNLWQQGAINLVVNYEENSFADFYQQVHGTSICAVALQVDDANQARDRAITYHCQRFDQAIGPGELEIPAVRTRKDSLIYLVDRHGEKGSIWEIDFALESPDAAQNALQTIGLTQIDHLGQVVSFDELSSWVLIYRSIFGFTVEPQFEIADPRGLVQSQVIRSEDGRICFTLNASQAQTTTVAHFLGEAGGSGIQHIAFATHDIFATVAKLEANGFPMLPIPPLYYEDVAARFGLDAQLVVRLKQHNILYDQNEEGEFFHVYTQTLADRFFFEIVERRGYRDFGAANAAIRFAAQAKINKAQELFIQ